MTDQLTPPRPPAAAITRGARVIALVALSLTFGLVQLDATVVTVALDAVGRDLGGGVGLTQWLVDAYAVPFAALLLLGGAAGDRFGHRRTCVAGFALFALASVPAALAPGWAVLLPARALQGAGAALMLPASLALVGELYPEPRERARALGVWGGIATTGFALGPVVGGVLVSALGWPAIFWLNVPVALVVGVVIARFAPADRRSARRLDRSGTLLAVAGLTAVVGGIIAAGQGAVPTTLVLLVVAVALAAAFVTVERRAESPLLPASVIAAPGLHWTLVTGFAFNFAMYGGLLCVSLTLQQSQGLGPLATGLAVLPMALLVLGGATASGYLTAALGPRRPMVVGLLLGTGGTVVLAAGGAAGSTAGIVAGLTAIGLLSLCMPAMTSVALGAVPRERTGLAGGALNTTRQLGGALGVAIMGAMVNGMGGRAGLALAALVAGGVLLVGCMAAVAATRRSV